MRVPAFPNHWFNSGESRIPRIKELARFIDEQTEAQGMTGLVQGHTVKGLPPEKQWYKNSRHCGRVVRVIFLDQGFDGGWGKTLWAS